MKKDKKAIKSNHHEKTENNWQQHANLKRTNQSPKTIILLQISDKQNTWDQSDEKYSIIH